MKIKDMKFGGENNKVKYVPTWIKESDIYKSKQVCTVNGVKAKVNTIIIW